ncbi:DUF3560 domain-containing protein [Longirhabdus pacifica]|uniref:DUF3560 domain-containing protein n=1 Tax=Longirhabdus pacifica TaxID=2305227 RepID=UPI0013E8D7C2|nr:DUF3560 domain-containing protein [Longirhabdus pacifica]
MTRTTRTYIVNNDTKRIELHFSKQEYQAISNEDKDRLRKRFVFSPKANAWVSRATKNHALAIKVAEQLGFENGKRLTFSEQLARKEKDAIRYQDLAEKAQRRAEYLQADYNEMRGNNAFFTQPIIRGHAGSEAFGRRREKIFEKYIKGFEELRKSKFYKAKALEYFDFSTKLKDPTFLNNEIDRIAQKIESEHHKDSLLTSEQIQYEKDKLSYFQLRLKEIGS